MMAIGNRIRSRLFGASLLGLLYCLNGERNEMDRFPAFRLFVMGRNVWRSCTIGLFEGAKADCSLPLIK